MILQRGNSMLFLLVGKVFVLIAVWYSGIVQASSVSGSISSDSAIAQNHKIPSEKGFIYVVQGTIVHNLSEVSGISIRVIKRANTTPPIHNSKKGKTLKNPLRIKESSKTIRQVAVVNRKYYTPSHQGHYTLDGLQGHNAKLAPIRESEVRFSGLDEAAQRGFAFLKSDFLYCISICSAIKCPSSGTFLHYSTRPPPRSLLS